MRTDARPILFLIAALATPALVPSTVAQAQTVLYEEDFSQGLGDWSATASWHWVDETDPCLQVLTPFPSGDGAVRYGDMSCSFTDLPFYGALTLDTPVDIPAFAQQPTLTFESFPQSELCNGWDNHYVEVSIDGGNSWIHVGEDCTVHPGWATIDLDLSAFRDERILVRFWFDAVDVFVNDGLGWVIDGVRITTEPCLIASHCVASPNSADPNGARMGFRGSARIHADDLVLTVDGAPPGQFGHFLRAPQADQVPLGDGVLCLGPGATGIVRLLPATAIAPNGHLERAFSALATQGTLAAVEPGATWHFQCWYRDPAAGGAGSNVSDALQITFCP